MNEQQIAVDQSHFEPMASTGNPSVLEVEPAPGPARLPSDEKEPMMIQGESSGEAPTASLVGSMSVFTLSDVLSLLAATDQTGELQVASEAMDGRLWLDKGALSNAHVGVATTIGQAVFELACIVDGWFYFTSGLVSSSGQPAVPVAAVLEEVGPQVAEWKEIRSVVPVEAIVSLSPTPPGQDVQIRSDQWQVLTTVGSSGRSVKAVLDAIGGDRIVGMRTLRDLLAAGLIVVGAVRDEPQGAEGTSPFAFPSIVGSESTTLPSPPSGGFSDGIRGDDLANVPRSPDPDSAVAAGEGRFESLAEVAIMPPPIAGDPWSQVAGSNGNRNGNRSGSTIGDDGVA